MAIRPGKLGRAVFSGGIIATAPLIAACSSGPSFDDWAATDGAAGRINLDDVQEAFRSSKSPTDFETRVNQIYEGDGLIFIRSKQDGERLILEGWEDLNGNNVIDDAQDDQLFSIVKETNNEYNMRGHHANGYYNSHFGAGNFLFTYMLFSSLNRGYHYQTPIGRGAGMRQQRTTYRQSSRYGSQVSRNGRFASQQQGFRGSQYQRASRNVSSGRQTYQQTQRATGGFKNSSSISRGSTRSSTSRRSGGSYRGGGGALDLPDQRSRRRPSQTGSES